MTGLYCFTVIEKDTNAEHIVYVGKTYRQFKERFEEHNFNFKSGVNSTKYNSIEKWLKDGHRVVMRSLLPLDNMSLSYGKKITDYDLEMMEIAFITYFKPVLNVEGMIRNYGFRYDELMRRGEHEEAESEKHHPIFCCNYWTPGDYKPVQDDKEEYEFKLPMVGDIREF